MASGFQFYHLKDPVCQDVWGEGVDGHLHWLSAFRTQELRLLLIDVLSQHFGQFWSFFLLIHRCPDPTTFGHFGFHIWASSYLQAFCAKGVLAGQHLVRLIQLREYHSVFSFSNP